MRTRGLILALVLASVSFAAGYRTGHSPSAGPPLPPIGARPLLHSKSSIPRAAETAPPPATLAQLEAALRTTRTGRDFEQLNETVAALDSNSLRTALAAAEKTPNRQARALVLRELLNRWSVSDPVAAMQHAHALPDANMRRQAELQVLNSWLGTDLTGATTWVQQLPAGQLRNQAFVQLVGKLAEVNPQGALALLDSVPAGQNRQQILYPIFNQWAAK